MHRFDRFGPISNCLGAQAKAFEDGEQDALIHLVVFGHQDPASQLDPAVVVPALALGGGLTKQRGNRRRALGHRDRTTEHGSLGACLLGKCLVSHRNHKDPRYVCGHGRDEPQGSARQIPIDDRQGANPTARG